MSATKTKKSKSSTASKKTTSKATTTKQRTKQATAKKASPASKKAKSAAGEKEVTIDRRLKADRRDETDAAPQLERREKVQRRRQIDPTTCERDYSDAEVQFMNAMDEYKRTSGRMFPTCSEVLEVIRDLGYVQLTPAEIAVVRPETLEESAVESAEMAAEEVAG